MASSMNLELLSLSNEEVTEVSRTLNTIGCCPRCVLRYLGEKRPSIYKAKIEDLSKIVEELCNGSFEKKDQFSSICPVCVGILEEFCSDAFLLEIKQCVDTSGYQFSDHQCSLTLPVSNLLREHSLLLHLKKLVACYDDIDAEVSIASVKDVWKWYCGPELSHLLEAGFLNRSPFDISIHFKHEHSDDECNFLLDVQPHKFRRRKIKKFSFETFTRASVAKALTEISDDKFKEYYNCPPANPSVKCGPSMSCSHEAVFVAGRYNKYSRILSQTPWIVDGKRKSELSVQELICKILLEKFKPTDHKLSSSGREDVDVRMLGTGRPFVIELINPHVVKFDQQSMQKIQEETNKSTNDVAISDLQIVSRKATSNLKEGEIEKTKSYSAVCWSESKVSQETLDKLKDMEDLTLAQKTPIRVLHRRPLAIRERVIHKMHATTVDEHHFRLYLSTQAGTYIKEFVHGDFGRTIPDLTSILGVECDILELDVESVNVEWPPRLSTGTET